MGSWGCPHEVNGVCQRLKQLPCDPGMKGCILSGRVVFSNPLKNRPVRIGKGKPVKAKGEGSGVVS